jgi:glycosyltransferase involved in cell wall biosynthesis
MIMIEGTADQGSPFVSVIMPAYNRASFLARAINSVLCQTYPRLEVIVVDDGSTDMTAKLMADQYLNEPRVRCLRHPSNQGAQRARNTGIRAARGSFIAFLDSDDEWLPDKLEKQMRLFSKENERLGVVYAGYREMLADGGHIDHRPALRGGIYTAALKKWVCDMNTIVAKKHILFQAGLLNEHIRAYQEWDLCINLARHGSFDYVAEPLAVYHTHATSTISKDLLLGALGFLDVVESHREEILTTCGYYTLSRHYLNVGHLFMLADHADRARGYFVKALKTAPQNIAALGFIAISLTGSRNYQWLHRTKKRLSRRNS